MAQGKTSKTMVWILMALLILGLGGFGVTNLSGTIHSVGSVGEKDISVNDYSRALQEELRALEAQTGQSLPFAQAQAFGIDRLVLARLTTTRSMDAENARLGISIGDENLRQELMAIPSFQGLDGSFDRDAYSFAIEQAGMSEADFEDTVREDTARSLLQGAVISGLQMPAAYADTVITYVGEERDFTWAPLTAENLIRPVTAPSEEDIAAFYEDNQARFMLPASRQITYVWLSPDMILDQVEIDETALEQLYKDRDAEFNRAERRLVERLAFADEAAAQKALDDIAAGTTTFEALVEARGLALSDVDLGDVTEAELGAAGPAVFLTPAGAVAGPAETSLGPAIFRVNGILPAQNTSFEEARDLLREELAADRARRLIDTQIGDIDDLLAGGATLEEVADETDMTLGTLEWHPTATHPLAGYEGFRAVAAAVTEEDFPQVDVLDDGGIFALRLEGETEARPAPLEDVREEAIAAITAERATEALEKMVESLRPRLNDGTSFTSFGFTANEETGIDRGAFIPSTPRALLTTVFEMTPGELRTVPSAEGLILVRLNAISAPDTEDPEVARLKEGITAQLSSSIAQDVFQAYAEALQAMYPAEINQQALNAVHAQFQ
ncbi:SurA N-terminal domain-containing protein [Shimia sp. R11_0]|uniref:peptidyl-prolyl cis-trans isomerase n=1 Tax=Shimia sp. R11_0 TaxID=2821096 RepID=UPI001ADC6228|nr:peptidyl-prolyl cis-trans isomerase [Shimia sp. R11_0]MBO9478262.1 SurA N-terminal domain-containing protein [Shimia sp. R11_0]